jgi:hypothetical protein
LEIEIGRIHAEEKSDSVAKVPAPEVALRDLLAG